MKEKIDRVQLSANIIAKQALSRWRIKGRPRLLSKRENYIYEVDRNGLPYILRVTEDSHHSIERISSALDWIEFLASHRLTIAAPIRSNSGRLIETISTTHAKFHATLFQKAPGQRFDLQKHWNSEFHRNLGAFIGQMHALTKSYNPPKRAARRIVWFEDPVLVYPELYLPKDDTVAWRELKEVLEWARSLPMTSDSFGLVHTDLHHSNYFVDKKNQITAFDFDETKYHWFAYDLAVPLFSFLICENASHSLAASQQNWFCDSFLEGYFAYNNLTQEWIRRIPSFVRLRRIEMYIWGHKLMDASCLSQWGKVVVQRMWEGLNWKEPLV